MHPVTFARLLVFTLPLTLLLTFALKQYEYPRLRRQAMDALTADSDAAAQREDLHIINTYTTVASEDTPRCSQAERAALFRAGVKLAGDNASRWLLDSGWGESADCCEWRGVGCGARGGVTRLTLAREGLRGTVPTEIFAGALDALASVDLNDNPRLSGTLPAAAFSSSSRLTHLYAYGCSRLSGTLPAQLGAAAALQELELSACRLSGTLPPGLGAMASLRFVFLEHNRLSGSVPPSLSRLRQLRELELSHNRLEGSLPARVARMHLDHLDVEDNPRLSGAPRQAPKQGCSGGGDRYLRGSPQGRAAGEARSRGAEGARDT